MPPRSTPATATRRTRTAGSAKNGPREGADGGHPADSDERAVGAAGSFTGLWALTWLGSSVMGAGAAVQGAFAVGGVMASSGLTLMWWKTRAIANLSPNGGATVPEAGNSASDP